MTFRIVALFLAFFVVCVGWGSACVIWRAAEIGELIGPLEPRRFQRMTLLTVGSGSAYENPERMGPCLGIGWHEQVILIDVGRGVAEGLRLMKIPVDQPRRLLLSSLMPENTMGLDDLLMTGWLEGREDALEIYGPIGTRAFVEDLVRTISRGQKALENALALPREGVTVSAFDVVSSDWQVEWDDLVVRATPLPGGPTPAVAWRFDAGGRSIVIGGSGWGTDQLVELAEAADVLVHEAAYVPPPEDIEDAGVIADPERLRREGELHTSIMEVGKLAKRAGVRTLVLTRMRPPPFYAIQVTGFVSESFSGKIVIPDDSDELTP